MTVSYQHIISHAYKAFNERNSEEVISLLHPNVHWPNGWEGGYVIGHAEVRDYWKRQWKQVDPHVTPLSLKEQDDGRIAVEVHQVVKDMEGSLLSDSIIRHIYTFENNLIKHMQIDER